MKLSQPPTPYIWGGECSVGLQLAKRMALTDEKYSQLRNGRLLAGRSRGLHGRFSPSAKPCTAAGPTTYGVMVVWEDVGVDEALVDNPTA